MTPKAHWENRILLPQTPTRLQKSGTLFLLFMVLTTLATQAPCSPVFDHFLSVAEMAQEPCVEQVHDGVFFPADVQIHGHPVVGQRSTEGPGRERNGCFLKACPVATA